MCQTSRSLPASGRKRLSYLRLVAILLDAISCMEGFIRQGGYRLPLEELQVVLRMEQLSEPSPTYSYQTGPISPGGAALTAATGPRPAEPRRSPGSSSRGRRRASLRQTPSGEITRA